MALSGEYNALPGVREEFTDCLRDAGACFVHWRFDFYSPRESSSFCGSHLRRSQNWRVQISSPAFLGRCLPPTPSIWMSFSSFARFFCANAWSDGLQISPPWFDRCTVAAGCLRPSPLVSRSTRCRQNYVHGLPPQSPLQAFDGKNQFARTFLRPDS